MQEATLECNAMESPKTFFESNRNEKPKRNGIEKKGKEKLQTPTKSLSHFGLVRQFIAILLFYTDSTSICDDDASFQSNRYISCTPLPALVF